MLDWTKQSVAIVRGCTKRRLADEYDAAQERGEVRTQGGNQTSKAEVCGPAEIGLTHKDIHEARIVRDAENADPGIVRRTLDSLIDAGEEPTKAAVKRAISASAVRIKPRRTSLRSWPRSERQSVQAHWLTRNPGSQLVAGRIRRSTADRSCARRVAMG